jgi:hypothetical protein
MGDVRKGTLLISCRSGHPFPLNHLEFRLSVRWMMYAARTILVDLRTSRYMRVRRLGIGFLEESPY